MPEKKGEDFVENLILRLVELTTPSQKKKTEEAEVRHTRPFSFRLSELDELLFKNRRTPPSHEEIERYTGELETYKEDELMFFKHLSKEIHELQVKLDSASPKDKPAFGSLKKHLEKVRKERDESKESLEQIDSLLRQLR